MRTKSQSVQVYNTLKPLKLEQLDYSLCLYECVVLRKKFIGVASRYLYIFPTQVAICKEQRKKYPDRQIPINNETRISWTYKPQIKKDGQKHLKSVKFHVGDQEFEYLGEEKILKDLKAQISLYIFQTKIQEEYLAEVIIDKGSYATVLELVNISSKQAFAAKCIDQKKIKEKYNAETMRVLSTNGHPNILKLHELYIGNQNFYIVMELAQGGSLLSVMKKRDTLFEKNEIRIIFKQLLEGLVYMHSFELMHRDLKPENLLFMEKDNLQTLKIADFGLAQSINEHPYVYPKCGTPGFVAPEVLESNGESANYGCACDIFSAGVILYILLTGEPLFDSSDRRELLEINRRCEINIDIVDPQLIDIEEKDLIKKMLIKDPLKRSTAQQCLEHSFFQDTDQIRQELSKSEDYFNFIESEVDVSQQINIANFLKNKMKCFQINPFIHLKNYDPKRELQQKQISMFISSNPMLDRELVNKVYEKDEIVGSFGKIEVQLHPVSEEELKEKDGEEKE